MTFCCLNLELNLSDALLESGDTRAKGSEKVDYGTLIIKYICIEILNLQNPSCPGEEWVKHG